MTTALLDRLQLLPGLSDELATLAARVAASVVLVRSGRGAGSGVVWSADGLVMTNHHVAPGAAAEIVLHDGAALRAEVVARDAALDLAALRVSPPAPAGRRLVAAALGNSQALRTGELVIAVGNPLGLRNSVSAGIVSALDHLHTRAGNRREVIIADLDLYPGNSGGALADSEGRVVGLPAMVFGPGRAVSIPVHVAERFLGAQAAPRLYYGFHGAWVPLGTLTGLARQAAGMLLLGIEAGSGAEAAGLLPGDIVLGPSGQHPDSEMAFRAALAAALAGRPQALQVLRGGTVRTVAVSPAARAA